MSSATFLARCAITGAIVGVTAPATASPTATSTSTATSTPTATPPPLPPPSPPTTSPEPATPLPFCRLGEHAGVDDDDAATAAQLVCAELSRAGAPADARYRVSLGKLGSLVILSVAREGDAPGSTVDSRQSPLRGIEEVTLAAPRLADALVHGEPMRKTETVDDLTSSETRTPNVRPATTHLAAGLIGMFGPLDRGLSIGPGISLELHAETNPFQIVGNLRFGGGSDSSAPIFVGPSVGARYFPMNTDSSLFVGGGLSWSYYAISESLGSNESGSGLAAYGEVGVEIMRTRHAHLAFGARLDVPSFQLKSGASSTYDYPTGTSVTTSGSSLYFAPLSFEARVTL
jgi:hypothetical protein